MDKLALSEGKPAWRNEVQLDSVSEDGIGWSSIQTAQNQTSMKLADMPICSFAAGGNCPYGEECPHMHGDLCAFCGKMCLHPYRPDERQEHIKLCEKNHKRLEALKRSQEIECSVCLDRVLSKPTAAERKFGLLSECDRSNPMPPPASSVPGSPAKNPKPEIHPKIPLCWKVVSAVGPWRPTSRALETGKATVSDSARAGGGAKSPANPLSDTTAAAASPAAAFTSAPPSCSGGAEALTTGGGCSRLSDRTRSLALPAPRTGAGDLGTRPSTGLAAREAAREHSTISMDASNHAMRQRWRVRVGSGFLRAREI